MPSDLGVHVIVDTKLGQRTPPSQYNTFPIKRGEGFNNQTNINEVQLAYSTTTS